MKRIGIVAAGLLIGAALLVSPLYAQEEDAAAAKARSEAFIKGLTTVDESLFGTFHFGIYLQGQKNIGTAKLTVAAAPEGSEGAYLFKMVMNMKMGPQTFQQTVEAVLAMNFDMLSQKQSEKNPGGAESTTICRDGGKITCVKTEALEDGENKETFSIEFAGPEHYDMAPGLVMSRVLAKSEAGKYVFSGVKWPGLGTGEQPAVKAVNVTVTKGQDFQHRGATVKATVFKIEQEDKDVTNLAIDEAGKILAFWPDDAPIKLIAGTEEEITQDIKVEKKPAAGGGVGTPEEAVKVYLMVLAKAEDIDALDRVMDWKTLHEEMSKDNEQVAALDPDLFASIMKSEFKKRPAAFSKEQAEMVAMMLEVEKEGDTAKITIPGSGKPFTLKKIGEYWKITYFPH